MHPTGSPALEDPSAHRSSSDIANAFDGITYQKGAAVINMFEQWVGENKFREGVRLYLKENADQVATAREFLTTISRAAGRDVTSAFLTFLDQAGVPVVSLDLLCNGTQPRVALSQHRYVPRVSPGAAAPQQWSIPVCVSYGVGGKTKSQCQMLSEAKGEIALKGARACLPHRVEQQRRSGGILPRCILKRALKQTPRFGVQPPH